MSAKHPLDDLREVLAGPVPGTALSLCPVGHAEAEGMARVLPVRPDARLAKRAGGRHALSPLGLAHAFARRGGAYLVRDADGTLAGYVLASGHGSNRPRLGWHLSEPWASRGILAPVIQVAATRLFEAGATGVNASVPASARSARETLARLGFEGRAVPRMPVHLSVEYRAFTALQDRFDSPPPDTGTRRRSSSASWQSAGLPDEEWYLRDEAGQLLSAALPAPVRVGELVIRRPGIEDVPAVVRAMPVEVEFRGRGDKSVAAEQAAALAVRWGSVVLATLADGTPVGTVSVQPGAEGTVELGWHVAEPMRARGHGTAMARSVAAALQAIGIERIGCAVDARNEASARLATAAGFVEQGAHPGVRAFLLAEPLGELAAAPCP